MLRRISSILLVLLFIVSVTSVMAASPPVEAKELPSTLDISIINQRIVKKLSQLKRGGQIDKSLAYTDYSVRVIALFDSNLDLDLLARHFKTLHFSPKIGSITYGVGVLKPGDHSELLNSEGLIAITRDIPIMVPRSVGEVITSIMYERNLDLLGMVDELRRASLEPRAPEIGVSSIGRDIEPTMVWVNDILGSWDVWNVYNVSGAGVTVAVVDTGVDYSSMGLGYDPTAVARDVYGVVSAFDADALGIAITNITVQAYLSGTSVFINSSNTDPLIYYFGGLYRFSDFNGTLWMADMNVTGILNPGEVAHFGLMFQWLYGLDIFPVLVVDSDYDGFYDTVYVDMSFDWVWMGLSSLTGYGPSTYDFSFADEPPLTPNGWSVGGRDFNGDSIYDIGVSSLGYGLDIWWVVPNIYDRGSVLKPIDPYGNYTVFVYDWHGHGTAVSNVVAGRSNPGLGGYSGVAPNASIMGIPALFIGDIIEGWLWAAGFDLIPGTEGWGYVYGYGFVYGEWTYTGMHKADIISNSWGWSSWIYYFTYVGLLWYDVLTVLEDALMVPGYLDPNYPGTLMVHAAGNGGPGYGTVTEPGYNTIALTVGASTSLNAYALLSQMYYGPDGYLGGANGDVIAWSARGPNLYSNVKPEILGIGAYGWTAGPVWFGGGNGAATFTLFGGTSMATPTVAGVAALALEAGLINGYIYDPLWLKLVLKATSEDLGYDALTQGVGLVDALEVVSLHFGDADVVAYSSGTYDNLYYKMSDAWFFASLFSSGYDLPFTPPSPRIYDFGWYAGDLMPGDTASTYIMFFNPNTTRINVTLTPLRYELVDSIRIDVTTYNYSWFGGTRPGALIPLDPAIIPPDADLMIVTSNISYDDFDPEMDYRINNDIYVYVLDWYDLNEDGIPYSNESVVVNIAYPDGPTTETKIGNPASKFSGTPLLRLYQYSDIYSMDSRPPINVTIFIKFLKRVYWDWITITPDFLQVYSIWPPLLFRVDVDLTVPSNASPGLYHGLILLNMTNTVTGSWWTRAFPVTVNVQEYVSVHGQLNMSLGFAPDNDPLYPAAALYGLHDWGWRAEAGDWRVWPIYLDVNTPYLIGAFTEVNWATYPSDIDLFSVDPWGWMIDGSEYTRIFGGAFLWETRTGDTSEYVAMWPESGAHKVVLHNVLIDGSEFPLNVSGSMEFVYMYPLPPSQLVNIYGSLTGNYLGVGANFQIISGRSLTNIQFGDWSIPSGWNVTYPQPFNVSAYTPRNYTVNIFVPTNTTPGIYDVAFTLTCDEFPYIVIVWLQVEVREFPLPLQLRTASSQGVISLDIPGEFGKLSLYYYVDPLNPSNSRRKVYPVRVTDVLLGERFTIISLYIGVDINGRTWWVPSTLVIDRETRTVYLFGYIQFTGKY